MSASVLTAILVLVAIAIGAAVLVWSLRQADDDEPGDDSGGGGGGQRLKPPPRHRGPHGGAIAPSPDRTRTRSADRHRSPRPANPSSRS
ncbi:MAG: hypothetical protein ACXVFN_16410 [Solirubrobacteraceae bacterium]